MERSHLGKENLCLFINAKQRVMRNQFKFYCDHNLCVILVCHVSGKTVIDFIEKHRYFLPIY